MSNAHKRQSLRSGQGYFRELPETSREANPVALYPSHICPKVCSER